MVPGGSLAELRDVTKVFRGKKNPVQALGGISFSLAPGELVGYLGPNGAGKTTTVRILLGLLKPSSGTVMVRTQRVGFVLDVPSLYPQLSLRDNFRFYARLLGVPFEAAVAKLEQVGMAGHLEEKVETFSLGMKKRAELARALLNEPELLLLDEPASGLDPEAQAALRAVLEQQRAAGAAILVTSHDLYNMQLVATRFLFLKAGRIVGDVPASEVTSSQTLEALYRERMGG